MKITKKWLEENRACKGGKTWFLNQKETDGCEIVDKLLAESHFDWANWLLCRMFDRKQRIRYAVYSSELVIDIFEKKYPEDKRPRKAIEAAKAVLENDTKENRAASSSSAYAAAYAAADAASSSSAYAAAAYAAAAAAADVAAAVYAAAYAASSAASARKTIQKKIISYGLSLLKG